MGSGKTTTGQLLARELGYTFIDTDQVIEEQEGMPITQIVEEKGMPYFRDCEKTLCQTLLPQLTHHIIATGGGMPMDTDNQVQLKKAGQIIYLNVPFETIWQRLKNTTNRPLLQSKEQLKLLYLDRQGIYYKLLDKK